MKVLLLGVGMQGKAALHDLVSSPDVAKITAADQDLRALKSYVAEKGYGSKVKCCGIDAQKPRSLERLAGKGFDVVIDLLPSALSPLAAAAAVRNGEHLVNSVYALPELKALANEAWTAGISILPEFGMDPGIDLVLLGDAIRAFDKVEEVWSYGAGIPEEAAANNAIRYKVTWTFAGVLRAYMRPGNVIRNGEIRPVAPDRQFYPENVHELDVEGVGRLEAYPNGDAQKYAEQLGLDPAHLTHMGRYALRWPGHCSFWKTMVDLHLLDDVEIDFAGKKINKRQFLAKAIEPLIRLGDGERDLAIIRIDVTGISAGKRKRACFQVIDRRDLETGLAAMNRCVGFSVSIGAQMLASGRITKRGLLSPATDVPAADFLSELERRGIRVTRQVVPCEPKRGGHENR